jgi:hypothetical protein
VRMTTHRVFGISKKKKLRKKRRKKAKNRKKRDKKINVCAVSVLP